MSATVVCDFFRVSFGKPFFFLLLRLAVFLAIVYKKEMDQKKNERGIELFLIKTWNVVSISSTRAVALLCRGDWIC